MILVAPSILSADFAHLAEQIVRVEKVGADWLHIDVMDGHFVPNLTVGPIVVRDIRKITSLFLDVHLMIENPERLIPEFAKAGADLITVHAEACIHLHRVISMIKDYGVKAGVAYNPATPPDSLSYLLENLDLVLLMTVNPGYGGQSFISGMLEKITIVKQFIQTSGLDTYLQVDGGINEETGKLAVKAGCNVLVAGSYVFHSENIETAVQRLKNLDF